MAEQVKETWEATDRAKFLDPPLLRHILNRPTGKVTMTLRAVEDRHQNFLDTYVPLRSLWYLVMIIVPSFMSGPLVRMTLAYDHLY